MSGKIGVPYYDHQFALVDADIRRVRKGDGRAAKIGLKRLAKIKQRSEIDMMIIAINRALRLKSFIERPRLEFRKSYSYDVWAERLILGKQIPATRYATA